MTQPHASEILVTGVARDVATTIIGDIERLRDALRQFKRVHWLIIESDSADETAAVLADLSQRVPDFDSLSLGATEADWPERTNRIANARNQYVHAIRNEPGYSDVQYVIVADLDNVNDLVTAQTIETCWSRSDWDVCAANQQGPYYDIWALRHPVWCPGDCHAEAALMRPYLHDPREAAHLAVDARRITLRATADWIPVDSAFGGLAVYRKDCFEIARYIGWVNGRPVCEHVPFHQTLRAAGKKLFINPALINTAYTDHSRYLHPWRQLRKTLKTALGMPGKIHHGP
ncbi:MAG: hypothetical protein CMN28_02180 [Salinisphaeraceae bacterium]|jgi:hypothetical protein|nr:hypothetical protein [Salinisphaeraceae bacterium]